jgi:hypothetical protein
MAAFLDDPEPTVRLQPAQRLNGLWDVARERMWTLFEKVAKDERSVGVLSHFISGPMNRVVSADTSRVMTLVSLMLGRFDRVPKDDGRDHFCEAVGGLVGWAYVVHDEPAAWQWLQRWATDLVEGQRYLWPVLHAIRDVFFFRYKSETKADELAMQDRAMLLAQTIIESGCKSIADATPHLQHHGIDDPEVEVWRRLYIAADQMIDQVGSQLYFGSGAYQSAQREGDGPGVNTPAEKLAFLRDYDAVLDGIAQAGSPRTLHYLLETLEYLIDGAPDVVFERISRLLLLRGAAEGYHFESLAVDELVKLIERYIADYRQLFSSPEQRKKLIEIIELFAKVGWPKALKLLYDLPELLR